MTDLTTHIALVCLLILALAANVSLSAKPVRPQDTPVWKLYQRAERFGAMDNLVYKSNVDPQWIGNTPCCLYKTL